MTSPRPSLVWTFSSDGTSMHSPFADPPELADLADVDTAAAHVGDVLTVTAVDGSGNVTAAAFRSATGGVNPILVNLAFGS